MNRSRRVLTGAFLTKNAGLLDPPEQAAMPDHENSRVIGVWADAFVVKALAKHMMAKTRVIFMNKLIPNPMGSTDTNTIPG
jgi:hypothetical protein